MFQLWQWYWRWPIGGLILVCLGACQPTTEALKPQLQQDQFIQAYFNHNQNSQSQYTDLRQIRRSGDNLEQVIIDAIDQAEESIDVAVQELNLPSIAQALVKKQQAGVRVRVILENKYSRSWSDFSRQEIESLPPRERQKYQQYLALVDLNRDQEISRQEQLAADAIKILQSAKIPLIDDTADGSAGSGLMHHKFVVIDGSMVITGSANFTVSGIHGDFNQPDTRGNTNNLVVINSSKIAQLFTEEFDLMWGDGVGGELDSKFGINKPYRPPVSVELGDSRVQIQFSPTSSSQAWQTTSNGLIARVLKQATVTIDLALFVFSDQPIADTLEKRSQSGIEIRALIEPQFAFRSYSEALDMLGVAIADKNCNYEPDNHPWQQPIATVGISQLTRGDLLHHKFAIIDNQTVITGSHNWSAAANTLNDETVLIIDNPMVAAHFQQEFEQLFLQARLGIPTSIQGQIDRQLQQCLITNNTNNLSNTLEPKLIDLNRASISELSTLPGIGEHLAEKIIAARRQKPFDSLEDLTRVSGIGKQKIEQLEGRVTW